MLALADEMVLMNPDGHLTGDQRAALAEHFDEGQILELGIVAALLTGIVKMFFVFDLVTRETSCPIVKPGSAH